MWVFDESESRSTDITSKQRKLPLGAQDRKGNALRVRFPLPRGKLFGPALGSRGRGC